MPIRSCACGLTRKTTVFELDAHVPLILATPTHKPGQQTDALVELLDLYPTLGELCGLVTPDALEGESLRPLLEDPTSNLRAVAMTQTPRPNYPRGKLPTTMGFSIRTHRYRYTEWRDFESGVVQARELYDHDQDPAESLNLAGDKTFSDIVANLARQLNDVLQE